MSNVYVVGADVHKISTQLVFLNRFGKMVGKERIATDKVTEYFSNFKRVLIGMEVSIGSQFLAKELEKQGHTVKVMPAGKIQGFYTGPKNDICDANAIAQAAMMDFVDGIQMKPDEALITQGYLKQRHLMVKARVALCNQLRGILVEQGIKLPKGEEKIIHGAMALIKEAKVSIYLKNLIKFSLKGIKFQKQMEEQLNRQLEEIAKKNEAVRTIQTIPGFGPINSLAFIISIGSIYSYKSGRDVSAFLGLVPKQNSSGEKIRLGGITKKGACYTRTLLIHGARAFVMHGMKFDKNKLWLDSIRIRRGYNKAVVAWANKMCRIAWSLLKNKSSYERILIPQIAA
ncbi:MAG: IS110 family transposase [Candidatus Aureabacteria bacterium]|nr:IS110 family transposase [Candidatus Auribacterota bacterium]